MDMIQAEGLLCNSLRYKGVAVVWRCLFLFSN